MKNGVVQVTVSLNPIKCSLQTSRLNQVLDTILCTIKKQIINYKSIITALSSLLKSSFAILKYQLDLEIAKKMNFRSNSPVMSLRTPVTKTWFEVV